MGDPTFARLIRKRRDALGLSQARLGELVGRSATTVRNWERGQSSPSERSDVVALAAVLGLDEHEVLERAGFDFGPSEVEDKPTMEQAYASLTTGAAEVITTPLEEMGEEPEPGPEQIDPPESSIVGEREPVADGAPPAPPGVRDRPDLGAPSAPAGIDDDPASPPLPSPRYEEGPGSLPVSRARGDDAPAWLPGVGHGADEVAVPAAPASLGDAWISAPVAPDGPDDGPAPTPALPPASGATPIGEHSVAADTEESRRAQRARRAAPPTVLEQASAGEPSYVEDSEQRERYRVRALATAVAIVLLVIVLLWSFDRSTAALGDLWQEMVDSLEL